MALRGCARRRIRLPPWYGRCWATVSCAYNHLLLSNTKNQHYMRCRYHSKYNYKRSDTTRFTFHCAQSMTRQHEPQKLVDASKHRDKESMVSFPCDGWLHITVLDVSNTATIKVLHCVDHVSYWTIDIPPEIDCFIRENAHLTVSQVSTLVTSVICPVTQKHFQLWTEILRTHPKPSFKRKSVYQRWAVMDRKQWKRDEDEIVSAKILISEASKGVKRGDGDTYTVQLLDSHNEPGFTSISFALPDALRQWGGRIRELSMDSACMYLLSFPEPENQYLLTSSRGDQWFVI